MRIRLGAGLLLGAPGGAARRHRRRGAISTEWCRTRAASFPARPSRITNTDTSQTQQLVTNSQGLFEAVLLNPGTYAFSVEMQGYKAYNQTGISLAVGQTLSLTVTLEVGPS